jgi:hypothetical protein
MSKKIYDEIEKRLVNVIYPELYRILSEKKISIFEIYLEDLHFAKTNIKKGDMIIWTTNPQYNINTHRAAIAGGVAYNVPRETWVTLGSILGICCPRRSRFEANNTMFRYVEFADRILSIVRSLRDEKKNIEKFISESDAFAAEGTREVLTEKIDE